MARRESMETRDGIIDSVQIEKKEHKGRREMMMREEEKMTGELLRVR